MARKINAELLDYIKLNPEMSKREIAAELQVGTTTVARYRKLIADNGTGVPLKNRNASKNNNGTCTIKADSLDIEEFKAAHGGRTPKEEEWLQAEIQRVESIAPGFLSRKAVA